jgi:hypothetical protein
VGRLNQSYHVKCQPKQTLIATREEISLHHTSGAKTVDANIKKITAPSGSSTCTRIKDGSATRRNTASNFTSNGKPTLNTIGLLLCAGWMMVAVDIACSGVRRHKHQPNARERTPWQPFSTANRLTQNERHAAAAPKDWCVLEESLGCAGRREGGGGHRTAVAGKSGTGGTASANSDRNATTSCTLSPSLALFCKGVVSAVNRAAHFINSSRHLDGVPPPPPPTLLPPFLPPLALVPLFLPPPLLASLPFAV